MKTLRFLLFFAFGWCLAGQAGLGAERWYVTDSFQITLRTGPSIENKIITMLRSGQPLELIDTNEDWSKVRVLKNGDDETEGWVMTRYLISRQPWEYQANSLRLENDQLKGKFTRIEKEWRETGSREKDTLKGLQEKTKEFNELLRKYEELKKGSADYIKLKEEHEAVKKNLMTSKRNVDRLAKENESLRSSQRNRWFGMGALVLLCGLMIGLAMGKYQKKQKSSIIFD